MVWKFAKLDGLLFFFSFWFKGSSMAAGSHGPAPSVFLLSSVFVLERGAQWLLDGAPVFDGGHGDQGLLDRVKGQMRSLIVSTVTTVTTSLL